jgi:hypothetical protein
MSELLIDAAERAMRYQEDLNGRGVAPDPTIVARLAELDIPLPIIPPKRTKPWRFSIPLAPRRWRLPGHASLAS